MCLKIFVFIIAIILSCFRVVTCDSDEYIDETEPKIPLDSIKWEVPPTYDEIIKLTGALAYVKSDGKMGLIDDAGKIILPIKYNGLSSHKNNLWVARNSFGKSGIINVEGDTLLRFAYDRFYDYPRHYVLESDGKYGLADRSWNIIFDVLYDDLVG